MRPLLFSKQPWISVRAGKPVDAGFSLLELMVAMTITLVLMTIVFGVMRQNQDLFATETGVTSMNENVRAAVDLITREIQAAGTGLRGFEAPVLGIDSQGGDTGDRLAVLLGDPFAPIAQVKANVPGTNGSSSVAILPPTGALTVDGRLAFTMANGKTRELYKPGDRYVLYRGSHFVIVRVGSTSPTVAGEIVVNFSVDESNPRARYGEYRYDHAADGNDALFARLDSIVYYRFDREKQILERRENAEPWAEVARGILGFQVRYRVLGEDDSLSDPLDEPPVDRTAIRSVVVTLRARTPDVEPGSRYYRETAERVEITPRNTRLLRHRGPDPS